MCLCKHGNQTKSYDDKRETWGPSTGTLARIVGFWAGSSGIHENAHMKSDIILIVAGGEMRIKLLKLIFHRSSGKIHYN